MNPRLDSDPHFGENLRRLALSVVDEAIVRLGTIDRKRKRHIHAVRRNLKLQRAMMRLIAADIGPHAFRREDRALRDVGRMLSGARDATAAINALDRLSKRSSSLRATSVRRVLNTRRDDATRCLPGPDGVANDAIRLLKKHRRRVERFNLDEAFPTSAVAELIRRTQLQMGTAWATRLDEEFHEWRKRLKHVAGVLQILTVHDTGFIVDLFRAVDPIVDRLGHAHDLVVLRDFVRSCDDCKVDERAFVFDAAQRHIQRLHRRATKGGHRLFGDLPDVSAARLELEWARRRLVDSHDRPT